MKTSRRVAETVAGSDASSVHFLADVDGHRAEVDISSARVEWSTDDRPCATEVIPISAITAVTMARAGLRKSRLVVSTVAGAVTFRVANGTAAHALSALAELSTQSAHQRLSASMEPLHVVPDGTAEKLINLKWFLDVGILTEAEFNEHRARLLGF
jgi:hypothetical protein